MESVPQDAGWVAKAYRDKKGDVRLHAYVELDRILSGGVREVSLYARPVADANLTAVRENIEDARLSLVGCFCTCGCCGEENDLTESDAVLFIDRALSALETWQQGKTP